MVGTGGCEVVTAAAAADAVGTAESPSGAALLGVAGLSPLGKTEPDGKAPSGGCEAAGAAAAVAALEAVGVMADVEAADALPNPKLEDTPKLNAPEGLRPEAEDPALLKLAEAAGGLGPKGNGPDGWGCPGIEEGAKLKPPPEVTVLAPAGREASAADEGLTAAGWEDPVDPSVWANLFWAAWIAPKLGVGGCAPPAACLAGRAGTV